MQNFYAIDLTARSGTDSIWRRPGSPSRDATRALEHALTDLDLPGDGFSSPFGFWFAPAPSWKLPAPGLRVEFVPQHLLDRAREATEEPRSAGSTTGRTVRASLKDPLDRARPGQSTDTLVLEINPTVARISVDVDTWSRVGDTVLFVIAHYWRFATINRALDDLSAWSRRDVATKTSFTSVIRRARSRELRTRRRELQAIILDLPEFEGPLTNPLGHLPSRRAVRLYRRLCLSLALGRLRQEIDERIEVVESVFDALAQSLDHFQSLAFQIALELVIVAVLLLDIALYFVDALGK